VIGGEVFGLGEVVPFGHRPNGPAAPCWPSGVRCHFPNAAVLYPFSARILGKGVQSRGTVAV
jgi:hypothetical protein